MVRFELSRASVIQRQIHTLDSEKAHLEREPPVRRLDSDGGEAVGHRQCLEGHYKVHR
jgi:hypothetical protein